MIRGLPIIIVTHHIDYMSQTNQIRKLHKSFSEIQLFSEMLSVVLIDDNIDTWKITLKYPDNKYVILQFTFHLIEPLPPKATVLFPIGLGYVCFEELGCNKWNENGNITTLLLSLYNEYRGRSQKYSPDDKFMSSDDAQTKWEFVKNAHPDWNFKDISKLMSEIPIDHINELRLKAKNLDKENNENENDNKNAENEPIKNITSELIDEIINPDYSKSA